MIDVATNIVKKEFAGKVDKGGHPYINHLLRVSDRSSYYYANKNSIDIMNLQVIGLLHDLIEDCPKWTIDHLKSIFQDNSIITAISLLTKRKDQPYNDYISSIRSHSYARAVKLADLEDNMDITRLKTINDKDLERLKKYHDAYILLTK